MKILNEDELKKYLLRHERRLNFFVKEGLNKQEALDLADRLFERDLDPLDNRRVCFECKNYNELKKTCAKSIDKFGREERPLKFDLRRCKDFNLKGK